MIDKIFSIVLVLNATGLFSFLAPQMGMSIGQVSLVLFGMIMLFLGINVRHSTLIFRGGGMGGWLFILVLWPLLTLLYTTSVEIRDAGLQLYFFMLFFGSVVYTAIKGLSSMYRVLYVSLVITITGLVLSMIAPQYFETVAILADFDIQKESRSFGFLLEPNRLAVSMVFLFIGWFALNKRKRVLYEVTAILAFLLMMLPTGSRTGMLMALIVTIFIMASWVKNGLGSGKFLFKSSALIACLVIGIIGMKIYLAQFELSDIGRAELIDRIETLLSFRFSSEGDFLKDTSVQLRFMSQAIYLSLIKEKPLLGHGLGSDVYYQETGPLFLSAHSDALKSAMEYGVLYPVIFSILMVGLYRKRSRPDVENVFQTNAIGQFVFIAVLLFATNSIMDSRTFYIVLGMFFASIYRPRYVFNYDEISNHINKFLTYKDISRRFAKKRILRKLIGQTKAVSQ